MTNKGKSGGGGDLTTGMKFSFKMNCCIIDDMKQNLNKGRNMAHSETAVVHSANWGTPKIHPQAASKSRNRPPL